MKIETFQVNADKGVTYGFIAENDNSVIVSIRGTDNLEDIKTDINAILVDSEFGKTHKGFEDRGKHLWNDYLKERLESKYCNDKIQPKKKNLPYRSFFRRRSSNRCCFKDGKTM